MPSLSEPLGDLSPAEKRAFLARLLRKKGEKPRLFPLSFAQQRLWLLDQLEPGNTAYLIPFAMRVDGPLTARVLERSLGEVVRRHESLRTTFQECDRRPMQVIHPAGSFCLPVLDLGGLADGESARQTQWLAAQEQEHPCVLSRGPLLRSYLIRLASQEHVLLLTLHHIISDGWSMQVLVRELATLYQAFASEQASPLPPLPIQYADYAVWQRQWLQGEILETQLAYWVSQLGGNTPLRLPVDHPRPEGMSYRGAHYVFAFPADLSEAIAVLSRQEGATLFMTLLSAFKVLLYRYTGQTDIVVGTDIANRTHMGTEELIGFFVNLLVLRSKLDGTLSLREVLSRTKEMVLGAYTHQDTPFEILVERLLPDHTLDRMPLIQAIFVLQNMPSSSTELPELQIRPFIDAEPATAKFDLAVFMHTGSQGLSGIVNYNSDLFERDSVATMMGRFEALLHQIVSHPEMAIDVLDFYTDAEKTRWIEQKNKSLRKLKFARGGEVHLP